MTDQIDFLNNLTDVHAGQYLALNDGGSLKIVQVQESNVADSYNLEPVDIENITLDLSDNYEVLQTLVQNATAEKLDISNLIIKWLKDYPTISEELTEAQNLANEKDKELNADAEQIQTLESKNQQLEKELAELKQAKTSESDTKTDDQSKGDASNTTSSSDQSANKD
ncbi:hypothetical protein [Lactobacillus crispatus]|uniref:Uncharacterized protein n=1 Tax=Lactobacillus crispatus TaxID=47770 RepID=A0AAW4DPG9_9LACO|nr:hypothetical protein [Lactobacillus crispatus]MBI1708252.1 hypothetical protein [Lactobacillus crispatus]